MTQSIDTVLTETRHFAPPKEFSQSANLGSESEYLKLLSDSQKDPVKYWSEAASDVHWFTPWTKALEWNPPFAKWYLRGKINASYNCLDRHILAGQGEKEALIWEGEDGSTRTVTYRELFESVCQLANALTKDLGLKAGDTAAIYMPLIPEAVIAMLACARVGVTHSVIFAGFSSQSIHDRLIDAESKLIFTSDIAYRKGTALKLIEIVRQAIPGSPVQKTLCFRRDKNTTLLSNEVDWENVVSKQSKSHEAVPLDAEHPLFFLYTSGTTGKPKGIVHSTGGYLVGVTRTSKLVFDLKPNDRYWCTADIGWITGHSYVVYGILSNGGTNILYEGNPAYPHPGRIWEIIEKHQATILYTAPTAIRSFMRYGTEIPEKFDLGSLRLLGSVGEPINPEAWIWYHKVIGKERCPIVDTWWQTETGGIMISPLPGVTKTVPGSATRTLPGIVADIVDEDGKSCPPNAGGYLVITHPWPSMLRNIHRDAKRYQETYWSKFPGKYFTGDGAHRDKDGYFWIKGRIDDVINVSGHRLGTMEIESALVSHPSVAEAAVVGRPDPLKGQAIVAFVIPKVGADTTQLKKINEALMAHVSKEIGALARPEEIHFTRSLPKTRSGKIMRRFLRDFAAGRKATGDQSTLENPDLLDLIT